MTEDIGMREYQDYWNKGRKLKLIPKIEFPNWLKDEKTD